MPGDRLVVLAQDRPVTVATEARHWTALDSYSLRAEIKARAILARTESLWSQVLHAVPAAARRDRGVYLARHATAAALAREPEQAVEIARTAVEIVAETRSARMHRELRGLERAMRPWHDAPVGRDLAEILAPVNKGS